MVLWCCTTQSTLNWMCICHELSYLYMLVTCSISWASHQSLSIFGSYMERIKHGDRLPITAWKIKHVKQCHKTLEILVKHDMALCVLCSCYSDHAWLGRRDHSWSQPFTMDCNDPADHSTWGDHSAQGDWLYIWSNFIQHKVTVQWHMSSEKTNQERRISMPDCLGLGTHPSLEHANLGNNNPTSLHNP